MNALEILTIEGIVVRHIPQTSTHLYSYKEGDENRLKFGESIVERNGRKFRRVIINNVFGGMYFITFKDDQGATVIFDKKRDGIGETIENAYHNYLSKNGVA